MQAIITRKTARKLIAQGKAKEECILKPDQRGDQYIALTRHDTQTTAHYKATPADVARLAAL